MGYDIINGRKQQHFGYVDVAIGTGTTQSGWTASTGDTTFSSIGISGIPFDTSIFKPVSGLGSLIPSAWSRNDMPAVDFYGNTRTYPGAPGAVK